MKKYVLLFVASVLVLLSMSQNVDPLDTTANINIIKRDTSYLYAESTMRDPVEAWSGAMATLELIVRGWVRTYYPEEDEEILVNQSRHKWNVFSATRGKYSRSFIYVKKQSLMPVAEQKVDTIDIQLDTLSVLNDKEKEMAEITSFTQIEPYIKGLKADGCLHAYGKYASLPEEVACYLFVYDRDGIVVSVLRQANDGSHFNLRTLTSDSVRNYKNCGAIWLQLK